MEKRLVVKKKNSRIVNKREAICKCCGKKFELLEIAKGEYMGNAAGVCNRPRCMLEAMRENL